MKNEGKDKIYDVVEMLLFVLNCVQVDVFLVGHLSNECSLKKFEILQETGTNELCYMMGNV